MVVQYKIESSEPMHRGIYTCAASNEYGSFEQNVEVDILSRRLTALIPQSEYVIKENEPQIEIPCLIMPKTKLILRNVNWYLDQSKIDSSGDDIYQVLNYFGIS